MERKQHEDEATLAQHDYRSTVSSWRCCPCWCRCADRSAFPRCWENNLRLKQLGRDEELGVPHGEPLDEAVEEMMTSELKLGVNPYGCAEDAVSDAVYHLVRQLDHSPALKMLVLSRSRSTAWCPRSRRSRAAT